MKKISIATRKSPLAIWQAEYVAKLLKQAYPLLEIEFVPIITQGDKQLDTPLANIGGKGLFLKELEQALADSRADIAVHSLKDVPAHMPSGMMIAAVTVRADATDALVSNISTTIDNLPTNAIVGTSSIRRKAQLLHYRPDLNVVDLRGNVGTRLSKLDVGQCQAIILASAGLLRLGLQSRIRQRLPNSIILPAIGQGVIAIECMSSHLQCRAMLSAIIDMPSWFCQLAERSCGAKLDADCQSPLAVHAQIKDDKKLHLQALATDSQGQQQVRQEVSGSVVKAKELGVQLAKNLLASGAKKLLSQ